ncbi:MAG: cupin domain-containing protein [Ferruginibacter sp.]
MDNSLANKLFIEDIDIAFEQVAPGVMRKVITYDKQLMLVKVIFKKDAIGTIHHHIHTQITYIEKGIFEVTIGDQTKTLETGSSFYVPPNSPHGVYCLEAGVLIDVFSPMREDFITK